MGFVSENIAVSVFQIYFNKPDSSTSNVATSRAQGYVGISEPESLWTPKTTFHLYGKPNPLSSGVNKSIAKFEFSSGACSETIRFT